MASAWLPPTASSIIGNAHKLDGSYCQDSFRIKHTANKKWVAIAVSDGAGSAKFAGQGSQFISEKVADALIDIGENLETKAPGHWINDSVISCLVQIRENLRQLARSDDISDYHATLVSVLLGPSGGFSIHIGDGAIFGGKYKPLPKSTISIDDGFFISKPENGEYANETFFLTEPAWVKHLRITPIPPLDWIAIATDGGCALALDGIFQPNEGFMSNLFTTIRNEKQKEWSSILSEALSDEKTHQITSDDKTVVLLLKDKFLSFEEQTRFICDNKKELSKTGSVGQQSPEALSQPPNYKGFIRRRDVVEPMVGSYLLYFFRVVFAVSFLVNLMVLSGWWFGLIRCGPPTSTPVTAPTNKSTEKEAIPKTDSKTRELEPLQTPNDPHKDDSKKLKEFIDNENKE